MTFTARVEKRGPVHYIPTDALLDDGWPTYTYHPTGDEHPSATLPAAGTEVEIVASDFTPGTRRFATIADPRSGHRYGTVPTTTLFVHHRKGCIR